MGGRAGAVSAGSGLQPAPVTVDASTMLLPLRLHVHGVNGAARDVLLRDVCNGVQPLLANDVLACCRCLFQPPLGKLVLNLPPRSTGGSVSGITVAGVSLPTSLRLSPNDTTAVNVLLVVGAPLGDALPGTSGSPPPQAPSNSAETSDKRHVFTVFMRSLWPSTDGSAPSCITRTLLHDGPA